MRSAVVTASVLLASASAEASAPPVVAVLDLQGSGSGFKKKELETVSEYVSTQLAASGRFQVVPRSEVKRALAGQKQDSYKQCVDESCQIELGKELAAAKTVVGSIRKFGKVCMVNLRMFDLAKAATERAGSARGECTATKVLVSVDRAVASLTGVQTNAVAQPTVTALTPSAPVTTAPPVVAPPPVTAPPSVTAPPVAAPPVAVAPGSDLLATARALSTTRHRRSYVLKLASVEQRICKLTRDTANVMTACTTAPQSRACRRAQRRSDRNTKRVNKFVIKRNDLLAKASRAEGQPFAQALTDLTRRVSECWCDGSRANRRACAVR